MNVGCSHCGTVFRIDPEKVPAGGIQARCSVCSGIMQVSTADATPAARPESPVAVTASEVVGEPQPVPAQPVAPAPQSPPLAPLPAPAATSASVPQSAAVSRNINPFLSRDPGVRAKRLARALISDMVTYYPAKHEEGLREGTLKVLFLDEIRKSHEEYVGQVGSEFAQSTTYFQDSLNDLLAGGKKVF